MKYTGCIHTWVVLFLFLGLEIFCVLPVSAESNPTVFMFDVQGNTNIPTEKILAAVSNLKMGAPLDSKNVQLDMQAIMDLGYFADVRVKTEKLFDGIKIIFEVVENPYFKEVQITGLTKIKPEELKPFFSQKAGEVFNTVTFKDDLSKVLTYCQEKKGLYVQPKYKGTQNGISANGLVKVELVEMTYGKTKILGLVKTKDFVIRRELSAKEGEIIDLNRLREDYLNIMRLRLFDSIEPRFEKSDQEGSLDLIMEAKEAQTGTLSVGISYSENSQELGGLLSYSEGNLMGLGQSISLDINLAESSRNVQFNFFEPWLNESHTSFGLSMWNSESQITSTMHSWYPPDLENDNLYDLDLARTGLSLSFGRPIWKNVTARIKFNFEKNTIQNFWNYHNDKSHNNPVTIPDPPGPERPLEFWDNSADIELTRNKLSYQDRNFVDGGYQLSGTYSISGDYLGGEFDYKKTVLDGKWFHSLSSNLVFGTRLQWANITGDYPDYDALYLGGMYKLRGYEDRRVNNMELIGTRYLLSNTELRYRLPSNKNMEFVLFYDAGRMYDGGENGIKSDYGIGFRFNVPFLGVLRFDQAWNSDHDAKLVFSLGELF